MENEIKFIVLKEMKFYNHNKYFEDTEYILTETIPNKYLEFMNKYGKVPKIISHEQLQEIIKLYNEQ